MQSPDGRIDFSRYGNREIKGSESRIYLRHIAKSCACAASNPKALLTACSDYQKCYCGSARLSAVRAAEKCGYIYSKNRITILKISTHIFLKICYFGNDIFHRKPTVLIAVYELLT